MVGESEEIKAILTRIAGNLESADGNASKLIKDVRDALRGTSEPTVGASILQLQRSVENEFRELKAVLRDEGGAGRGTITRPDGDIGSLREGIDKLGEKLGELLSRIERSTTSLLGEMGEGHGGGGHGGESRYRDYFERERYLSITKIVDELSRRVINAGQALDQFKQILGSQLKVGLADFMAAIGQAALQATSMSGQFRNLQGVIKNELHSFMSQGAYGSNALGPFEHMFEGPKRALDGVLFQSDSLKSTLKSIQQAMQEDLQSPISAFGRDTVELSRDFHEARRMMREQPGGFDSRAWMSTEAATKSLYDMVEINRRMGIQQMATDSATIRSTSEELNFLKAIAAMTGKTVEVLEPIAAQAMRENAKLESIGRMSPDEAKTSGQIQSMLVERLGQAVGVPFMNIIQELRGYGRTREDILQNPKTPEDTKRAFSTESENMMRMLSISENMMRALGPGETLAGRTEEIKREVGTLAQSTKAFVASGGPGSAGWQQATYGGMLGQFGIMNQAGNVARGTPSPDQAVLERQQDFTSNRVIGTFQDWWKNQIAPILSVLPGAITANTGALFLNTAALYATRGGGLGGFLGSAGKALGTVGKIGLAGAGAAGVAYEGYNAYSNVREGNTGAAIGGTVGMGVGGLAGGALAGLFSGGFGTAVGASIGATVVGQLGSWIGSKFDAARPPAVPPANDDLAALSALGPTLGASIGGTVAEQLANVKINAAQSAPAVPSPTNMAGPNAAEQIYSAQNQGYQDANLGLQGQIVQAITQGNQILSQIYGENARQTGFLRSDPNGAGGGIPAGSGGRITPPQIGRPDASYPYVAG